MDFLHLAVGLLYILPSFHSSLILMEHEVARLGLFDRHGEYRVSMLFQWFRITACSTELEIEA